MVARTRFGARRALSAAGAAALCLMIASHASAQSFNIDIDSPGVSPALGGGVPASTFAGAALQPGVWNSYFSSPSSGLVDVNGAVTPVSVDITSSSTTPAVLGFNNPNNTGDFALLFNDGTQIGTTTQGGSRTYSFSGLVLGPYFVTTYTGRPQGTEGHLLVEVVGSAQGQLVASGTQVPNTFTAGVDHVVHTLIVNDGTIDIRLTDVAGAPAGYVGGFQITLFPEPAGTFALLTAPLALLRRQRSRG